MAKLDGYTGETLTIEALLGRAPSDEPTPAASATTAQTTTIAGSAPANSPIAAAAASVFQAHAGINLMATKVLGSYTDQGMQGTQGTTSGTEPGDDEAIYIEPISGEQTTEPNGALLLQRVQQDYGQLFSKAMIMQKQAAGEWGGSKLKQSSGEEWTELIIDLSPFPDPLFARRIMIDTLGAPNYKTRKNQGKKDGVDRFQDIEVKGTRPVFAWATHSNQGTTPPHFHVFVHHHAIDTSGPTPIVSPRAALTDSHILPMEEAAINAALAAHGLAPIVIGQRSAASNAQGMAQAAQQVALALAGAVPQVAAPQAPATPAAPGATPAAAQAEPSAEGIEGETPEGEDTEAPTTPAAGRVAFGSQLPAPQAMTNPTNAQRAKLLNEALDEAAKASQRLYAQAQVEVERARVFADALGALALSEQLQRNITAERQDREAERKQAAEEAAQAFAQIEQLEAQNSDMSDQLSERTTERDTARAEATALQSVLGTAQEQLAKSVAEVEALRTNLADETTARQAAENRAAEIEQERAAEEQARIAAEKLAADTEQKRLQVEAERNRLQLALDAKDKALADATAALAKANSERDAALKAQAAAETAKATAEAAKAQAEAGEKAAKQAQATAEANEKAAKAAQASAETAKTTAEAAKATAEAATKAANDAVAKSDQRAARAEGLADAESTARKDAERDAKAEREGRAQAEKELAVERVAREQAQEVVKRLEEQARANQTVMQEQAAKLDELRSKLDTNTEKATEMLAEYRQALHDNEELTSKLGEQQERIAQLLAEVRAAEEAARRSGQEPGEGGGNGPGGNAPRG